MAPAPDQIDINEDDHDKNLEAKAEPAMTETQPRRKKQLSKKQKRWEDDLRNWVPVKACEVCKRRRDNCDECSEVGWKRRLKGKARRFGKRIIGVFRGMCGS